MRIILISMVMLMIASGNSVAQDHVSSHERAAAEFIDILQLEKSITSTLDAMSQSMTAQNPMSAQFTEMMVAFTKETMRWEDLRPEYIRMYRDAYTEAELRELIAFYKTPVGRKTMEIGPELMKQTIEFRQKQMQQHLPELQRRIRALLGGGGS